MKILLPAALLLCINVYTQNQVTTYHAEAWRLQTIPGKIECEFYDRGGEGISYHDSDGINNGSGKLNPANGNYLNEFRKKEGVDISYTKSNNIDNNLYNKTTPLMNQLYVGWTQPGEWIKYTIVAKESGNYRVGLMYTANGDGAITLDLDDKQFTGVLRIPSTHDDADTVAWRQWHHWNKSDSLTTLAITKGKHVLTLHVAEHGNMNFDYLEFSKQ
jgi:hypothetical protein